MNSGNNLNIQGKVKVINRVLLIGIHESVTIFDAPDAELLFKITTPFHAPCAAHIHPVISIEEAKKAKLKNFRKISFFF